MVVMLGFAAEALEVETFEATGLDVYGRVGRCKVSVPVRLLCKSPVLRLVWDRDVIAKRVGDSGEATKEAPKQQKAPQVYHDNEGEYRWITVHPHGDEEKGVPIKIRPSRTNPGTWHVVAGAGGKLNYLTLHDVGSVEEHKEKVEAKRKTRRDAEKAKKAEEREKLKAMSPGEREAHKAAKKMQESVIESQRREVELQMREKVAEVAKAAGWDPKEWQFESTYERLVKAGTSPKRIEQLERDHLRKMVARADQLVGQTKRQVLVDHDARAEAGLADLPLRSDDPNVIGLTDLDKDKTGKGPGYRRDVGKMSDSELTQQLATRDVERLEKELQEAKDAFSENQPATKGRIDQVSAELRAATVIRDNAGKTPEQLAEMKAEVDGALKAVADERRSYLPELLELRGELGRAKGEEEKAEDSLGRREELVQRYDELAALEETNQERLRNLQDQQADVSTLLGKPLAAVTGERKEVSAKRTQDREDALFMEGGQEAVEKRRAYLGMMQDGLKRYRDEIALLRDAGAYTAPEVDTKAPIKDPAKIAAVLRAGKALQMLKKDQQTLKQQETRGDVDERLFGKALFIESKSAGDPEKLDAAVKRDFVQAMAEQSTRTFLTMLDQADKDPSLASLTDDQKREALQRHLSAGTYNALNNASQILTGAPSLTRDVVEVLGPAASAQLLARSIQKGRDSEDIKAMAEGLGNFHLKNHMEASQEAVTAAQEAYDQAKEIELGASSNPADLAVQQELNASRRGLLLQARSVLGRTLGEMESMAQLTASMRSRPVKRLEVNLGPIASDAAIRQARAIGLDRGDYEIDTDGVNRFLKVNESGMDKLVKPPDPADLALADEIAAIKAGERDEADYVPPGMIKRPATSFTDPNLQAENIGAQQRMARPFNTWGNDGDVRGDVEDHLGARIADGEDPNDILPDILSHLREVPEKQRGGVMESLDDILPTEVAQTTREGNPIYRRDEAGQVIKGEDGKPIQAMKRVKADYHREALNKLAESYMRKAYGSRPEVAAFHAQGLKMDTPEDMQKTGEAMYRALAADPRASVAFKPAGELSGDDQQTLRHYFNSTITKPDAKTGVDVGGLKQQLADLGPEPEKESTGLFGKQINPAWAEWNQKKNEITARQQENSTSWPEYVNAMGGTTAAYGALQDRLKHDFIGRFRSAYATQHGEPLKVGKQAIRGAERHLGFVDPAAREKMAEDQRKMTDSLRNRVQGRYAEGSVKDKVDRLLESQEIERQNQIGFFGGSEAKPKAMNAGDRESLGMRAENQIAALMGNVARNLGNNPNEKVDLNFALSMSGKNALRERTIKGFLAAKRVNAALGVGTGKTAVSIGAFTAAASDPKSGVKRGIWAVPSQVQGQFHGELAKTVEPGKFNWNAVVGAGFNDRMAAHRDPSNHMMITTHQSLRDDMMKLVADHWGTTSDKAVERFVGLGRKERAQVMREAWDKAGIDYQAAFVDEGHNLLDRRGKEDSLMSGVLQAVSDNTSHFMSMSGDPVKNDISELRSQLDKIYVDGRYSDEQAWHKRYGLNTSASHEALKREIGPRFFMGEVAPPVKATRGELNVELHPEQQKAYDAALAAYDQARSAHVRGDIDLEAVKTLSPGSFAGQPEERQQEIARRLSSNLGIIRDAALNRTINLAPAEQNGKIQHLLKELEAHDPKQEPTVVFARNLDAVHNIEAAAKAAGHRVATMTGEMVGKEKDKQRNRFQPGAGQDPDADVFVLSDAGATGLNLQRGKRLINYDTPMTAMTHAQRCGRIHRNGQKQDVDLLDMVTNTPFEQRARQRMHVKYDLRGIFKGESVDDSGLAAEVANARKIRKQNGEPPVDMGDNYARLGFAA